MARSATAAGFGAFSVVFASFTLALGLSRAVSSEALVVRYSGRDAVAWRRGTTNATGVAIIVGVVAGTCCAMIAPVLGGALAAPLVALGVTLPGLLLQDCWRYAFFANGEGRKAFVNDAIYAAVLLASFGALMSFGRATVASLVLVWGAAATAGAAVGMFQARTVPAPHRVRSWAREQRDLIPRYAGEFLASTVAGQLSIFLVGVIAGLGTLGSLRAAYLLFGPLQVLFMGIGLVAVPELVRILARSPRHLQRASAHLSAALAAVALTWGVTVMLTPTSLGRAVIGSVWSTAHPLAIALTMGWMASAVIAGAAAGVRALAAAKRGLAARIAGSLLGICGAVIGARADGARGAAWGLALGACVECTLWWMQLGRAVRDREPSGSAVIDAAPFVVRRHAVVEEC